MLTKGYNPENEEDGRRMTVTTRCPQDKRGFTLIELLVVIAIISILASMLLPALTEARAAAQQAACIGRMRNFQLYVSFYRNEYNGWFPINRGGASWNWVTWPYLIKPYTPLKSYALNTARLTDRENIFLCPGLSYGQYDGVGSWADHVLGEDAWYCGQMDGSYFSAAYYGSPDIYGSTTANYYRACRPKKRAHNIVPPGRRIQISEIWGNSPYRHGYLMDAGRTIYPHRQRTNIVLLDGHIETFPNLTGIVNSVIFFYQNAEVQND